MNLLIVEDHKELNYSIVELFNIGNFICDYALLLVDAKKKIQEKNYQCYIIDAGLPDGYGMELITYIRSRDTESAILIISENDSINYKVQALRTGADDYITKPFNLLELHARVLSVLRGRKLIRLNKIILNEIKIGGDISQVFVNHLRVKLTPKEFELLLLLINNKNKIVTRESIVDQFWNDIKSNSSFDFLYTHIKNLKKKLIQAGSRDYIQNVKGIGYCFRT